MRVLGFPVHVRRGFLFFMVLIVVLYGDEYGVWLAGAIAAFTLLHELGHAVAARRAGATAEISLDFLAGYASYTAPKPLSRGVEAVIALAGPVIQITAGFIVLAAMGVDPLDPASRASSPAATAVWWAGPAIGAFNLIPVLPLDGGNVVTSLLDRFLPGRARSVMVYVSLALTATAAVVVAVSADLRGFVFILGLLLVMQLQLLFDDRAASRHLAVRQGHGRPAQRRRGPGPADRHQRPAAPERHPGGCRRRWTDPGCASCWRCCRGRSPTATRGTSTC